MKSSIQKTLVNMFTSSKQSKYMALALVAMYLALSVAVFSSPSTIPSWGKISIVLGFLITLIPSTLLSLLQVNCIVEGSSQRPWCSFYAWIVVAMVIIIAVLTIFMSVSAVISGEDVLVEQMTLEADLVKNGGDATTPAAIDEKTRKMLEKVMTNEEIANILGTVKDGNDADTEEKDVRDMEESEMPPASEEAKDEEEEEEEPSTLVETFASPALSPSDF